MHVCRSEVSNKQQTMEHHKWHDFQDESINIQKGETIVLNLKLRYRIFVDIRKDRGDNPLQDSPVKESAIRLFNENTTPDTDSTETELTLLKFRLDQNQSRPHTRSRSQSRRTLVVSRHCFSSSDRR
jgi:hypothetical protein